MKQFKLIYNNKTENISVVSLNDAIDIAIGVSNNIKENKATVISMNEEQETAEVNIYLDDKFERKEVIQLKII
jgi:hypothetical protein